MRRASGSIHNCQPLILFNQSMPILLLKMVYFGIFLYCYCYIVMQTAHFQYDHFINNISSDAINYIIYLQYHPFNLALQNMTINTIIIAYMQERRKLIVDNGLFIKMILLSLLFIIFSYLLKGERIEKLRILHNITNDFLLFMRLL